MSWTLSLALVPGVCRGFEIQTQRRCPLTPRPWLTGLLTAARGRQPHFPFLPGASSIPPSLRVPFDQWV